MRRCAFRNRNNRQDNRNNNNGFRVVLVGSGLRSVSFYARMAAIHGLPPHAVEDTCIAVAGLAGVRPCRKNGSAGGRLVGVRAERLAPYQRKPCQGFEP